MVANPFRETPHISFIGADELVQGASPNSKTVTLRHDVVISDVAVGPFGFHGEISIKTHHVAQPYTTVAVTPSASLPPGWFESEIPLIPITTTGERLPPVPMKIDGVVDSAVATIPSTVAFPSGVIGETVRTTLQVCSRAGKPLKVVEATGTGRVSVTLLDDSAAGGPLYELSKIVDSPGPSMDHVHFQYLLPDGNYDVLMLIIGGYGISAKRSL